MREEGTTGEEQRYARLLEAAEAEFVENGFAAANVARMAAAAGISKKTVYKHVASKEALFIEVVTSRLRVPAIAIADSEGLPLEEALLHYFDTFAELSFSRAGLASHRLVLTEGARFPDLAPSRSRACERRAAAGTRRCSRRLPLRR